MEDDSGFRQEFDPQASGPQRVIFFCRMCRRRFTVELKVNLRAQVKCHCGHEGTIAEFDVFTSAERAKDFAVYYSQIMNAVAASLLGSEIPIMPASGIGEGALDEDYGSRLGKLEAEAAAARSAGDIFGEHEALTRACELSYECRLRQTRARSDCERLCRADLQLTKGLIDAARKRREAAPRLIFASFKLLSLLLEEEGRTREALEVVEEAQRTGLRGYDARAERLRLLIAGG